LAHQTNVDKNTAVPFASIARISEQKRILLPRLRLPLAAPAGAQRRKLWQNASLSFG